MKDDKIAKALDLEGEVESLCLRWTSNVERNEEDSRKVILNISGPNEKRHTLEVRTVKHLSLPSQNINYKKICDAFPHLRGLAIKDYVDARPSVLIGLNNLNLYNPKRIREGRLGEPTAVCTRLGRLLYGSFYSGIQHALYSCHICECIKSDNILNSLIKQFYELETSGISGVPNVVGTEELRSVELLDRHTIQKTSGHYETSLLWKYDDINLPSSYEMAKKRLICLERMLNKNTGIRRVFDSTMYEYFDK